MSGLCKNPKLQSLLWVSIQSPRFPANKNLTGAEQLIAIRAQRLASQIAKLSDLFGIVTTMSKIYFDANSDLHALFSTLQLQVSRFCRDSWLHYLVTEKMSMSIAMPNFFAGSGSYNPVMDMKIQNVIYFTTLHFLQLTVSKTSRIRFRQSYLIAINVQLISCKSLYSFFVKL